MRATPGSVRRSKRVDMAIWSAPRVTTIGHRQSRVSDIVSERATTGVKPNSFGYRSMGLSVPLVITTDWKRSKTDLMARLASRQLNWITGSGSPGVRSSKGSKIMAKPWWYVPTSVAKSAIAWTCVYSSVSVISSVLISEPSRS